MASHPWQAPDEWDYYAIEIQDLNFRSNYTWGLFIPSQMMSNFPRSHHARVILDTPGEAYLAWAPFSSEAKQSPRQWQTRLVAKIPKGMALSGRMLLPKALGLNQLDIPFKTTRRATIEKSGKRFNLYKAYFFGRRIQSGVAGAGWFRNQCENAWKLSGDQVNLHPLEVEVNFAQRRMASNGIEDSYAMFTSGRALAENLRLDRALETELLRAKAIDISTIDGIDLEELDWTQKIKGLAPELDVLAVCIPKDQYAAFFASLSDAQRVLDEVESSGSPVLGLLDPRSEHYGTTAFYQRQLCLDTLMEHRAEFEGLLQSIAVTGSDPYFRTGTDVAILIQTATPDQLLHFLLRRYEKVADANPSVKLKIEKQGGMQVHSVRSTDRNICSYLALLEQGLVVTNSPQQLQRILDAQSQRLPDLASAPEYIYFRDRYRLAEQNRTGFLVLTDAAIRRWGSPKWRIGAARRVLASAKMVRNLARDLAESLSGDKNIERSDDAEKSEDLALYGTLEFLTPILELDLNWISSTEAEQYQNFRERYQGAWRDKFDPIAASFTLDEHTAAVDVSVIPLIANSEYRSYIDIARGVQLAPDAADIHPESILHFVMSIDHESEAFQSISSLFGSFVPTLNTKPLRWIGDTVSFYLDSGLFWDKLADPNTPDSFADNNLHLLPLGLEISVKDPAFLTFFLAGLRGFTLQIIPGAPPWQTRSYKDHAYVEISLDQNPVNNDDDDSSIRIYYVILPKHILFGSSKEVIHRAIDRHQSQQVSPQPIASELQWQGKSVAVSAKADLLKYPVFWQSSGYQRASWLNIPILNEWRRLFPDRDPLEVHATEWGVRLLCPGGGTYVWNEEWRTMESTVYGHPSAPTQSRVIPPVLQALKFGSFGLTFEDDGLRAKAVIHR